MAPGANRRGAKIGKTGVFLSDPKDSARLARCMHFLFAHQEEARSGFPLTPGFRALFSRSRSSWLSLQSVSLPRKCARVASRSVFRLGEVDQAVSVGRFRRRPRFAQFARVSPCFDRRQSTVRSRSGPTGAAVRPCQIDGPRSLRPHHFGESVTNLVSRPCFAGFHGQNMTFPPQSASASTAPATAIVERVVHPPSFVLRSSFSRPAARPVGLFT